MYLLGLLAVFDNTQKVYHTPLTSTKEECVQALWDLFWRDIYCWRTVDAAKRLLTYVKGCSFTLDERVNEEEFADVASVRERVLGTVITEEELKRVFARIFDDCPYEMKIVTFVEGM